MFPISQVEEVEYFRPGCLGKIQKCMWDMFEKPHTSFGAKVTQTFLLDNDLPMKIQRLEKKVQELQLENMHLKLQLI